MSEKLQPDAATLKLIDEVKRQQKEIKSINSPNKTNCSFAYADDGNAAHKINLLTQREEVLVDIVVFLLAKEQHNSQARLLLGLEAESFKWMGYTLDEWVHDIKNRIGKLNMAKKEDKLKKFKERLDAVLSPEMKRQLEIEAIAAEMELDLN